MADVLILMGASLTDICCTLDAPGLPDITYNVTRIADDAFAGRFGAPEEGRFDQLYNMGPTWDKWAHLDRLKVARFAGEEGNRSVSYPDWSRPGALRLYKLIDIPTIAVALGIDGITNILPVDGNHRMMARELRGLPTFDRFVVPREREAEYRVSFKEF
jgi:hypothetical protein